MENFLERFQNMVDELAAHPQINVLNYTLFPPVTSSTIETIEEHLGHDLNPSISNFYYQTNGLQLRWKITSNATIQIARQTPPLDWKYALQKEHSDEGLIMILPIEMVFWEDSIIQTDKHKTEQVTFKNREYATADFYKNVRSFDLFSAKNGGVLFISEDTCNVLIGSDYYTCLTDSRITTFESYLEFLIANKGSVSRRNSFYKKPNGHLHSTLHTTAAFWIKNTSFSINTLFLRDKFPECDRFGASTKGLRTLQMQQQAAKALSVTTEELETIIEEHHTFLSSGGAGGKWRTLSVQGVILGIYTGGNGTEGKQAAFDGRNLGVTTDWQEVLLPFSNFCGVYGRRQDFSEADLSYSLFVDAMLEEAIFADTNLQYTDFSRANLRGVSFMNADLRGTDFENCDLTNADFRGANLDGSRFPGAILDGVKI